MVSPTDALSLEMLRQLRDHCRWADDALTRAFAEGSAPPKALRELAHLLAAEEVWLARLEGRSSRQPVWPALTPDELLALHRQVHDGYDRYLGGLDPASLTEPVEYANSAGREFSTPVGEILLHVALHGQYHRGKVNQILREAGADPVPVDFIAFVRGAPAAVTPIE